MVPIPCDASRDELDTLFTAVNGLLFTGGETDVKELDSTYMRAAGHLLNLTIAANQVGEHVLTTMPVRHVKRMQLQERRRKWRAANGCNRPRPDE